MEKAREGKVMPCGLLAEFSFIILIPSMGLALWKVKPMQFLFILMMSSSLSFLPRDDRMLGWLFLGLLKRIWIRQPGRGGKDVAWGHESEVVQAICLWRAPFQSSFLSSFPPSTPPTTNHSSKIQLSPREDRMVGLVVCVRCGREKRRRIMKK